MTVQSFSSDPYQAATGAASRLASQGAYQESKVGIALSQGKQGGRPFGAVGDIVSGTLVRGGDNPVVRMQGTEIRVKSSALSSVKAGEEIYLKITGTSADEVTMKMIGKAGKTDASHGGVLRTEIQNNTVKFVEQWNRMNGAAEPSQAVADMMEAMSPEEEAELKRRGIAPDCANATLVKAMLSQIRGDERKEALEENLESIRQEIAYAQGDFTGASIRILGGDEETLTAEQIKEEADSFLPLSDDSTVYLLQNDLKLSIDDMYKAQYAGGSAPVKAGVGASEFAQMRPQIERTIKQAGLQVAEDTLKVAEYLLNHDISMDTAHLQMYRGIQDVNANGFSLGRIRANMLEASQARVMEVGGSDVLQDAANRGFFDTEGSVLELRSYRSVDLYFASATEVAGQVMEDLSVITDEAVESFAETGLPYTLEALADYAKGAATGADGADDGVASTSGTVGTDGVGAVGTADGIAGVAGTADAATGTAGTTAATANAVNGTTQTAAITAQRQMEEIRLKMTWEVSYRMTSEDIHLRTKDLTEVVDHLRKVEQQMMKDTMNLLGMEDSADVMKQAVKVQSTLGELGRMPAQALGISVSRMSFTMTELHAEGAQILKGGSVASKVESYETLMTAPRADMGDSISKAFRNVDDILADMDLAANDENRRAVRILGYNSMEITMEHIEIVRAADTEVQQLLNGLTPAMTLQFVRDGINPLDMPITEVNEKMMEYMQDEMLAKDEHFSDFLERLDRKGAISDEERTSYIGIYRLLDRVSSSKGKDVGTLVRDGRELTLGNLLSAHRSNRVHGKEQIAGDDAPQKTAFANDIESQILSAFQTSSYHQAVAGRLLAGLTPDLIDEMVKEGVQEETLEDFYEQVKAQLSDETEASAAQAYVEEMQAENKAQMQQIDAVLRDLDLMPSTVNLAAAGELLSGGSRMLREMMGLRKNYGTGASASVAGNGAVGASGDTATTGATDSTTSGAGVADILTHMEDALDSPDAMEAAYEQLKESIGETMRAGELAGRIQASDVRSMMMIRAELGICQRMARKESYNIPVEVEGGWSMMRLTVIQGAEETGKIDMDLPTESYGHIFASVTYMEGHFVGNMSSDHAEGQSLLARRQGDLEEGLAAISDMSIAGETPSTEELYRVSKRLVRLVRTVVREG